MCQKTKKNRVPTATDYADAPITKTLEKFQHGVLLLAGATSSKGVLVPVPVLTDQGNRPAAAPSPRSSTDAVNVRVR